MINEDKTIVLDIDGTICPIKKEGQAYLDLIPYDDVIDKVREYKELGYYLIFYTARNMRTHQGNVGKINATTLKDIFTWLDEHNIPYDEVHVGKPWPGKKGFYVDDRTIRPSEFRALSEKEIFSLLESEL
jgi:capsule biosynthesis phosphatase